MSNENHNRLYNNVIGDILNLKNSIIECQDLIQLTELNQKVIGLTKLIEKDAEKFVSYEKKRLMDDMASLLKYVSIKNNSINSKKFQFFGKPIPPVKRKAIKAENHETIKLPSSQSINELKKAKKSIRTADSHVLISNFKDSIITTQNSVPSIHIQNGDDSIVLLGSKGPIFAHKLTNALLVLKCHQLRLHNIQNCTIFVEVSNDRIIIENCSNLRIGSLQDDRRIEVDDFSQPNKKDSYGSFIYLTSDDDIPDYEWIHEVKDGIISDHIIKKMKYLTYNPIK